MTDPLDLSQALAPSGNGSTPATHDLPSVEGLLFSTGVITVDQLRDLVRDAVLLQRPVATLALERGFVREEDLHALLTRAETNGSIAELRDAASAAPKALEATLPPEQPTAVALQPVAPTLPVDAEAAATVPTMPSIAPLAPTPEDLRAASTPAGLPAGFSPGAPTSASEAVEPFPAVADTPAARVAAIAASTGTPVPDLTDPPTAVATTAAFTVLLHLQSGERLALAPATSFEHAADLARTFADRFATASDWPLVGGRYIRPETVVSIDVERFLDSRAIPALGSTGV